MPEATISPKGQLVIPASVREEARVKAGMRFEVERQGNGSIVLRPLILSIKRLKGALHAYKLPEPPKESPDEEGLARCEYALDSSLLLAYIRQAPERTLKAVNGRFESLIHANDRLFVSRTAIVEVVEALAADDAAPRQKIQDIIGILLSSQQVVVESPALVSRAIKRFAVGVESFRVYLKLEAGLMAGAGKTLATVPLSSNPEGWSLEP